LSLADTRLPRETASLTLCYRRVYLLARIPVFLLSHQVTL
jgi:hypothetical protein